MPIYCSAISAESAPFQRQNQGKRLQSRQPLKKIVWVRDCLEALALYVWLIPGTASAGRVFPCQIAQCQAMSTLAGVRYYGQVTGAVRRTW